MLAIFCALVLVATTFISHTVGAMVILPIVRAVGAAMPVRKASACFLKPSHLSICQFVLPTVCAVDASMPVRPWLLRVQMCEHVIKVSH